jgi:heme exporter protein B
MSFLQALFLVLSKDLRLEARRLDGLASMVFLATVTAMVLALALGTNRESAPQVAPGVLWVSSLLAATVGLGRALARERQLGGFRGLLLTPMSRAAIYLGKSAALFVMLLATNALLLPLTIVLFHMPVDGRSLPLLAALIFLGMAGFSLVGVLLGSIALRARTGEMLLGAVMYPLVIPILVGGVKGTMVLLQGGAMSELQPWVGLLLLSDTLYLVAGLWLFESLTSE